MKKLWLFVILIALVTGMPDQDVFGQKPSSKSWRTTLSDKAPERPASALKAVTQHLQKQGFEIASAHDQLTKVTYQSYFGDDQNGEPAALQESWYNNMEIRFHYTGGQLTDLHFLMWDDEEEDWVHFFTSVYGYDGEDLISNTFMISMDFGVSMEFEFRILFSYQMSGGRKLLHTIAFEEWDGEEWVGDERFLITADNGVITQADMEYWDGSQWQSGDERLLLIQEGDDLIELSQLRLGEVWINDYRVIHHNTNAQIFHDWILIDLGTEVLIVDEHLEPDYTEQYWDEDEWIDDFRRVTENVYETPGDWLRQRIVTWENYYDEWESDWRETLTYDEDGQLEQILESYASGEVWYDTERQEMHYNVDNRLIEIMEYDAFFDELSGRVLLQWGDVSTGTPPVDQPYTFRLAPAYPNPFNPSATIRFSLPDAGPASLKVYDILGRQVAVLIDGVMPAGEHLAVFQAGQLAGGVYLIRLDASGQSQTQKVTLMK